MMHRKTKFSKTKTVESEYIQSDANYINSFIGNLRTVKFIQLTINHNIISISFKKKICPFTVTQPTLFSAATLVHFIGKSKVDISEIFGLKKLFPVPSWKIIGINSFIIRPQHFFRRYYNTSRPESNQIYSKVRYLFRIRIGPQSGISVCEIKWKNKIKIRPTYMYPIFLEDVTVNRHIFFWALGEFSLIINKHGPLLLIYLGLENGLTPPCTSFVSS